MFAIVIVVGTLVGLFLSFYLNARWRFRNLLAKISGPRSLPIFGNSLLFKDNQTSLKILTENDIQHGPTTRYWLGPFNLFLVTTDVDLVEIILSSPKFIQKIVDYRLFMPWLGQGIFTCIDAGLWHKRRKIITPGFHFKILEDFIPIFHNQAEFLVENLNKHADQKVFNAFPYVNAYAMDVICETAMGVKTNSQQSPSNEYVKAVHQLLILLCRRGFSALKRFDWLFMFTEDYRLQNKYIKIIHDFDRDIIRKRRQQMTERKNLDAEEVDEFGVKKRMAFLDILLQATIDGVPLSDQDITEEVDTLMFGGHDTVSSTTSFALFAISKHPEIQVKLVEELKTVFGDDKDRVPDMRDLQQLKYMEMVIKETLRLYTTVPFIARNLKEDIHYNGLHFPKGLEVVILQYQIHRNPEIFPDPEKFDPERFSLDSSLKRHPFAFIPFSAGPRNCIGQKYAMVEMKVALSKVLRNFEFLAAGPEYEVKMSADVVMKSVNGINLRIKRRDF